MEALTREHGHRSVLTKFAQRKVSEPFLHLPMFLSWCLHASLQHANHVLTSKSISTFVVQQSNELSERSS